MKNTISYLITIQTTHHGLVAKCPALDLRIYTSKSNINEIKEQIKEAISLLISSYLDLNEPLPKHKNNSNIQSETIYTFVTVPIKPNINKPDLAKIKRQLYYFRYRAKIKPRIGVYNKSLNQD